MPHIHATIPPNRQPKKLALAGDALDEIERRCREDEADFGDSHFTYDHTPSGVLMLDATNNIIHDCVSCPFCECRDRERTYRRLSFAPNAVLANSKPKRLPQATRIAAWNKRQNLQTLYGYGNPAGPDASPTLSTIRARIDVAAEILRLEQLIEHDDTKRRLIRQRRRLRAAKCAARTDDDPIIPSPEYQS
jgi:hypothetical protein